MSDVAKKIVAVSTFCKNPADLSCEDIEAMIIRAASACAKKAEEIQKIVDAAMLAACRDLHCSKSVKKLNITLAALRHVKTPEARKWAAAIAAHAPAYFELPKNLVYDKKNKWFELIDAPNIKTSPETCTEKIAFSDYLQSLRDEKKAKRDELRKMGAAAQEDFINALPRIEKLLKAYEKEFKTGAKSTELPKAVQAMKLAVKDLIDGNWD